MVYAQFVHEVQAPLRSAQFMKEKICKILRWSSFGESCSENFSETTEKKGISQIKIVFNFLLTTQSSILYPLVW